MMSLSVPRCNRRAPRLGPRVGEARRPASPPYRSSPHPRLPSTLPSTCGPLGWPPDRTAQPWRAGTHRPGDHSLGLLSSRHPPRPNAYRAGIRSVNPLRTPPATGASGPRPDSILREDPPAHRTSPRATRCDTSPLRLTCRLHDAIPPTPHASFTGGGSHARIRTL